MTVDRLLDQLDALQTDPPSPLAARVYAEVVEVHGPDPMGPLMVAFTDEGISYLRPATDPGAFAREFRDRFGRPLRAAARPPRGLTHALRTGRGGGLDYDLRALSPFEQAVLRKAMEIPRGETRPYSWVASEIGRPRAVRAAGSALARNPVPILIPCHRVVLSDGNEGHYLFGTDLKRRLLLREDANLEEARRLAAAGARYLGSDTTGVVCYPSCHHARRIAPAHRVGFPSLAHALDAGYRACRHCRPAGAPAL